MGPKAQKAVETRGRLTAAARELFAHQGYGATGTEAVLAAAGVTRGALYHHFADKQALFAAVCEELHAEAAKVIEAAAEAETSAYGAVLAGCLAFLDFMAAPEVRRILLLDAPSVLGWEAWNAMDRRHGFGLLVQGVEAAVADGSLEGDAQVLAVLLNGALNEGVVWAGGEPAAMNRLRTGFLALMARLHV
jgi:AcrR family transcriptional regulator